MQLASLVLDIIQNFRKARAPFTHPLHAGRIPQRAIANDSDPYASVAGRADSTAETPCAAFVACAAFAAFAFARIGACNA